MKSKTIFILLLSLPLGLLAQLPPEEDLAKDSRYFRHEFAKRGGHKQEMRKGDYVIIGSLPSESEAVAFSGETQKTIEFSIGNGYLSKEKKWLVYISLNNATEARALRTQLVKKGYLKDVWLLTVSE